KEFSFYALLRMVNGRAGRELPFNVPGSSTTSAINSYLNWTLTSVTFKGLLSRNEGYYDILSLRGSPEDFVKIEIISANDRSRRYR
ncbi:hypothetical protein K0M31_004489, partial [Melipona bicolor]